MCTTMIARRTYPEQNTQFFLKIVYVFYLLCGGYKKLQVNVH